MARLKESLMRAYVTALVLVAIISIAACGSDTAPPGSDAGRDVVARDTGVANSDGARDSTVAVADAAAADGRDTATRDASSDAFAASDGAADRAFADAAILDAAAADATPDSSIDFSPADTAAPAPGPDGAAADATPGFGDGTDAGSTTQPFLALDPCLTENSYVTGPPTVSFRVTTDKPGYAPPCLKVRQGTEVTFTAVAESFADHPLEPRMEGSPNNPITLTTVGTAATFSLPTPGFFPYHCAIHPTLMVGVIWVTE
jgi:plastocyanin